MSEDDPDYTCLTLKDGPTTMPVFVQSRDSNAVAAMLESRVSVVGTFNWALPSVRRYARPLIVSRLQDIEVVSPPPPRKKNACIVTGKMGGFRPVMDRSAFGTAFFLFAKKFFFFTGPGAVAS